MGDFGAASRDKWVCPSDRELSLRAKLQTGWSVKSGPSYRSPASSGGSLSDAEREAIVAVVKRAEKIDHVEQQRVGRLVDRLENMRRNAMGDGSPSQCRLCAHEFRILAASPLPCADCNKAVCSKCGVETSGGGRDMLWLCKICSETRETWKKSGAWFYRGLPKYILPPPSNKYGSRAHPQTLPTNKGGEDSSDDEFRSSRLAKKATTAPVPVTEPTTSPQVDQNSELWYRTRDERAQKEYKEASSPRVIREEPFSNASLELSVLFDAHNRMLHCTLYRAKGVRGTSVDGLSDPYVCLQLLPDQAVVRTRTVHRTINPEFNEAVRFVGVSDIAKRTLRIRVLDESDPPHRDECLGEVGLPLRRLRPHTPQHDTLPLTQPEDEEDDSSPRILLSLLHSSDHSALLVGVLAAAHLPSHPLPDPGVRVQLKSDAGRRWYKTVTKKKTCNPEFNEQFGFEVVDLNNETLEVSVWDHSTQEPTRIGVVRLGRSCKSSRLRHWLEVMSRPDIQIEMWHHLATPPP